MNGPQHILETFDLDEIENKDLYQSTTEKCETFNQHSSDSICTNFHEDIGTHFTIMSDKHVYSPSDKLLENFSRTNRDSEDGLCHDQETLLLEHFAENGTGHSSSDSYLDINMKPVGIENAARERTRVKTLRGAFLELQRTLPAVPPDTKLSKLDVLVLATTYIAHLMRTLSADKDDNQIFAAHGIMHPVKKWPMRSRLYAGILSSTFPVTKDKKRYEIPWAKKSPYQDIKTITWRKSKSRRLSNGIIQRK